MVRRPCVYVYFRRRENIDKKYYNCVLFNLMAWKASCAHRTVSLSMAFILDFIKGLVSIKH